MRKYYSLFLIITTLFGCSNSSMPTEISFDSSINGKSITIRANEQYTIELELNSDAGYQWESDISNPKILQIDSTSYRSKSSDLNLDGGITIETFYFSGKKRGHCVVNLFEHRVWEKDATPLNTVQFKVTIK